MRHSRAKDILHYRRPIALHQSRSPIVTNNIAHTCQLNSQSGGKILLLFANLGKLVRPYLKMQQKMLNKKKFQSWEDVVKGQSFEVSHWPHKFEISVQGLEILVTNRNFFSCYFSCFAQHVFKPPILLF